jgi:hypothetical protein
MSTTTDADGPSDALVDTAGFLVATRVRHEANLRASAMRSTLHEDPTAAAVELDADEQLRAASMLLATRTQAEANQRIVGRSAAAAQENPRG